MVDILPIIYRCHPRKVGIFAVAELLRFFEVRFNSMCNNTLIYCIYQGSCILLGAYTCTENVTNLHTENFDCKFSLWQPRCEKEI